MTQPTPFGRRFQTALLLAALTLSGAALSGCSEEKKEVAHEVRPVKVIKVEPVNVASTLVYSGSVKARTEMNLGFRINGKIVERRVDIGDRVKKGDVLMRLDRADIALSENRAKANLEAARQQFDTADAAWKRADQLFRQRTIPLALLEQRKLTLDQARSALTSAESAVNEVTNQLAYTDLVANRDGVVTLVQADAGQVIGAGNVAVVVAADDEKEVQISVPETDIAAFTVGQTVDAGFWADPSLKMKGTVREIAASADPLSRTFAVRVSLKNDPAIRLGMTATVEAAGKTAQPVVNLPLSALSKTEGRTVVWVVDAASGTVSPRDVTTGPFTPQGVSIDKGLSRGDIVVAAGTQFMTDHLKVRLPEGMGEALAASQAPKPAI